MKKTFTLLSVVFVVLVFFAAAQPARACSCLLSQTVDVSFEKMPNIVVLKLRAVEKYADGENGYGSGRIKQSKLTVEKVYKGKLKVGQELTFAQGGGADCIWTFFPEGIGQEYLFYLGSKPDWQNVWAASTCSRSGNLKYRSGDIKYLESIAKVRGKTRLSGVLSRYIEAATEDETTEYNPLSGAKVTVKGNGKSIELKTDENGLYEIYDLPAGQYTLTAEKIDGYTVTFLKANTIEVTIKPAQHTEQDFSYSIDNRLSGKFYDSNGNPLGNVCLRLLPARGVAAEYFRQDDCTETDGSFEFKTIPVGSYILVINDEDFITANQPFRKFYYPSAARREDAAEINVGAGTFRDDLIITAPQTAETITISGVVTFEKGGAPTTKENFEYVSVKFVSDEAQDLNTYDRKLSTRAGVDEKGRFTIRVLKGWKGKLFADKMGYGGKYENCPKLDKLFRVQGDKVGLTVKTNLIEMTADSNLTGVELKFPFPSCNKDNVD